MTKEEKMRRLLDVLVRADGEPSLGGDVPGLMHDTGMTEYEVRSGYRALQRSDNQSHGVPIVLPWGWRELTHDPIAVCNYMYWHAKHLDTRVESQRRFLRNLLGMRGITPRQAEGIRAQLAVLPAPHTAKEVVLELRRILESNGAS